MRLGHASTCTYTCPYIHSHTRTQVRAHAHTHTNTHTRTYKHTHGTIIESTGNGIVCELPPAAWGAVWLALRESCSVACKAGVCCATWVPVRRAGRLLLSRFAAWLVPAYKQVGPTALARARTSPWLAPPSCCAVGPPQTPPGAVTSYTAAQDTPVVIDALGGSPPLFTNPSGASLTLGVAAQPDAAQGHVDVNTTDGTATFVPAAGFVGNATFELSASDGLQSANATITVTVGECPPAARAHVACACGTLGICIETCERLLAAAPARTRWPFS